MDLVFFWSVLLKRKWIIVGAALLAATLAYLLTMNQPKKFRSITQISTGFTVSDEVRINDNFNIYESETKFSNAIITVSSPSVVSLLSYKLILHDLTSAKPFRRLTDEQRNSEVLAQVNLDAAKKTFAEKLSKMSMLTSYNEEEKSYWPFCPFMGTTTVVLMMR